MRNLSRCRKLGISMLLLGCFLVFSSASTALPLENSLKIKPFASSQVPNLKIPTPVRGVKISITDPLIRSVKLSWIANPKSENVDEYAVYSHPEIGSVEPGVLLFTTSKTHIKLFTWYKLDYRVVQPPHTVHLSMFGGLQFWVIAHNKYGWGENRYFSTPYPGKYRQVPMTDSQQAKYEALDAYTKWQCTETIAKYYGDTCP